MMSLENNIKFDEEASEEVIDEQVYNPWKDNWRKLKKNKMAIVGLVITVFVVVIGLIGPYITPHNPFYSPVMEDQMHELSMQGPSLRHPFGTDRLGRDLFSRVIYGTRISLMVGVFTQLISVVIGITLGSLAGFFGGIVDDIISYLINVFLAFPFLLFAIAIMAVFEDPGINQIFIALGLISWPALARIVRGTVMSIKEKEYIEAVRSLGASNFRIIIKHVIPNSLAPIIVTVTLGVAGAILAEAGLSFLGIGVQPPMPSWGIMLSDGRSYIRSHPYMMFFPGFAIMFTVLGFNLFGDGLRDILDPKMDD